jgi:hypothetical protein
VGLLMLSEVGLGFFWSKELASTHLDSCLFLSWTFAVRLFLRFLGGPQILSSLFTIVRKKAKV